MKSIIVITCLLLISLHSYSQEKKIDFETTNERISIDTINSNNEWVIDSPSKTLFNSAYSGTSAIITNNSGFYKSNNVSSFTVGFELYGSGPSISFKHKFDTDKNRDGGYVEFYNSADSTWTHLSDSTAYLESLLPFEFGTMYLYNSEDTLYNGRSGFSGDQKTWKTSIINFRCMAVKKSFDFYLRFTFISDSIQSNKEGWVIDDIIINNDGECSGIESKNSINLVKIYPNPVSSTSTIKLEPMSGAQIVLYNSIGNRVYEKNIKKLNSIEINAEDFNHGIYFYKLIDMNNSVMEQGKFLIQ